jgi:hypothetical protein
LIARCLKHIKAVLQRRDARCLATGSTDFEYPNFKLIIAHASSGSNHAKVGRQAHGPVRATFAGLSTIGYGVIGLGK